MSTKKNLSRPIAIIYHSLKGMERVVIINTIEAMREALLSKGNDFSGRPLHFMTSFESRGGKGIVFQDFGKSLVQARKMVHQCMTLYGKGFEKIESIANQQSDLLCQEIEKLDGKLVDVIGK